jgi:SAM-dependent methyltransferase
VNIVSWLLERTLPYRLCQAPFAEQKFEPVLRHNDLARTGRVLDVACGPGTNAGHFRDAAYLGIDINERYIGHAIQRHGPRFKVMDVTNCEFIGQFDFILVNSFFHHVPDATARSVLFHLQRLLGPAGHVHVLDLVRPGRRSVAGLLERLDRGNFARGLQEWRMLFGECFEERVFEPYAVEWAGVTFWNMVYFKGASRR